MSEKVNNTIINLDDDPDFNALLKVVLKREGYQLFSATKPDDFAKLIKNLDPALVMIDINLDVGQGAGFTFLEALRNKLGLDLPVLVCSRRSARQDISRAMELGANDFIPKPLDDTYLLQKLAIYLRKKDTKPLPYFKISERDWPCKVNLQLQVQQVSEIGVTLSSQHFLSKGTYVELEGELIGDITGRTQPLKGQISHSYIDEETHLYNGLLEFDATDSELLGQVRSFLLRNAPGK